MIVMSANIVKKLIYKNTKSSIFRFLRVFCADRGSVPK